MPKKKLDPVTLGNIADLIWTRPGQAKDFFIRAGLNESQVAQSDAKFTYNTLQSLNEGTKGGLVPEGIERVLLRLVDPREYSNNMSGVTASISKLNHWLQAEEFELVLEGVRPRLKETVSSVSIPTPGQKLSFQRESVPDFGKFVKDNSLLNILSLLWEEAQRCAEGGAYLAAVLMMGSILEGVLLHIIEANMAVANSAKAAPKDKTGKVKLLKEWRLNDFIEVAHEVHWLDADITNFSHALRQSRNFIHPGKQRQHMSTPDRSTAVISWHVVRAALDDLMKLQTATSTRMTP